MTIKLKLETSARITIALEEHTYPDKPEYSSYAVDVFATINGRRVGIEYRTDFEDYEHALAYYHDREKNWL